MTGRRRPPKNARALRLAAYLTGAVPAHPAVADHFTAVTDWGLYRNDEFGDCGPVAVANQRKLVTRYLTGAETEPAQSDVFDLYRASGNPAFDPSDPGGPGDAGVDMQTMCEALTSTGIGGVKAVAFARVDHTSRDALDAAVAIFGSVLLGVNLQTAQQTQTDKGLWDYKPTAEWGGHAVLAGRYATLPVSATHPRMSATVADRTGVVTWAELVDMTDAFMTHQLEEAWVVVWPEHLGSGAFLQGVNLAELAADYQVLTGRPFPFPTDPPAPAPAGTPDLALAGVARDWVTHHHTGGNAAMAAALRAWLAAKNLQGRSE